LSGKRLSGKRHVRESDCPGKVLSGKRLSGKVIVRETSVKRCDASAEVKYDVKA